MIKWAANQEKLQLEETYFFGSEQEFVKPQ
jgi:hypothetical protein